MRRETQNVLLILVGGALLKISITDQYMRYVKPSFQLWLIACGVVTILLAVVGIIRDLRQSQVQPAAAGHGGGDHGHEHSSRSPWLLMLPVFAIFLVAPAALGADKVERSSELAAVPRQSTNNFAELPDGPAPLLKMGETVTRAIWDDSGSLDGRQVRLDGFVVHGKGNDTSVYLARLVIGCCAADASPIKVILQGGQADQYASDTWLEVQGEIEPGSAVEENNYVPTFVVSSVEEINAPPDPYEF